MDSTETRNRALLRLEIPGEGQRNYSIVAGAGGGKTTMLSERISRQIELGTPIDEFVIITYTNAAANELRDKIASRLSDKLKADPENKTLQDALANVELMQISTIHSFLLKILREYAFESHVALGAELLEDEYDLSRKKAFFGQWRRAHYQEIYRMFRDDWLTKGTGRRFYWNVLQTTFLELSDIREEVILHDLPTYEEIISSAKSCVNSLLGPMVQLAEQLTATKEQYRPRTKDGKGEKKFLKDTQSFIDSMNKVKEADLSTDGAVMLAAQALAPWFSCVQQWRTGEKAYYQRGNPDPFYDEVAQAEEAVLSRLDTGAMYMDLEPVFETYKARKAVRYVQRIQQAYQEAYAEEPLQLNNNEILVRAEQFLLAHPEVLDRLRSRYTKIYVDEFQDTTGLQTRIVEMLAEKPGTAPEDTLLAEDKLVVVGDPKQSIYRFTGAEIAVYEDVNRMMTRTPGCEVIQLNYNFRSNKAIIDWVNAVYTDLMENYEPMKTEWITQDERALHGVFTYPRNEGEKNSKDNPTDARWTVGLIQALVSSPACFLEEKNGRKRRLQYSDFMVITRNTTNMSLYADEFYARGIPVSIAGKISVARDKVLENFTGLLSWFANAKNLQNRYTAIQVCSGDEISRISEEEILGTENRLRTLYALFERQGADPAAIVQYLMNHEEYYVPKNTVYSEQEVRQYRIHLHQMIEACLENKDVHNLTELVDAMEQYRTAYVERDLPLESGENAVRLMNVHKSKGLTANVVIIADRTKKEEPSYSGFRKAGKYYPAADYRFDLGRTTHVPTFRDDPDTYRMSGEDETAEAIRLQYVAATRAAHALIFMPAWDKDKQCWFADERYGTEDLPLITDWYQERKEDLEGTVPAEEPEKKGFLTLEDLREQTEHLSDAIYAVDTLTVSPSQLEGDGLSGYTAKDEGYLPEDRPSGKGLGLVMHKAFELLVRRYRILDRTDEEKAVERILNEAVMSERDEMLESDDPQRITAFLKPVLVKYLKTLIEPIMEQAVQVLPEYTFSFYVEEEELPAFLDAFRADFRRFGMDPGPDVKQCWINGTADLVVLQKGGTVKIYDYKSDARNGMPSEQFTESLRQKYAGQQKLYRYAVRRAFSTDAVSTELVHLYL
ncbi:MAG: UvrD-helicase domain-containing protein [Solobacterium sp.]|nr:UvrD-helicase domain-containing protein [Solobacterium sp.]